MLMVRINNKKYNELPITKNIMTWVIPDDFYHLTVMPGTFFSNIAALFITSSNSATIYIDHITYHSLYMQHQSASWVSFNHYPTNSVTLNQ